MAPKRFYPYTLPALSNSSSSSTAFNSSAQLSPLSNSTYNHTGFQPPYRPNWNTTAWPLNHSSIVDSDHSHSAAYTPSQSLLRRANDSLTGKNGDWIGSLAVIIPAAIIGSLLLGALICLLCANTRGTSLSACLCGRRARKNRRYEDIEMAAVDKQPSSEPQPAPRRHSPPTGIRLTIEREEPQPQPQPHISAADKSTMQTQTQAQKQSQSTYWRRLTPLQHPTAPTAAHIPHKPAANLHDPAHEQEPEQHLTSLRRFSVDRYFAPADSFEVGSEGSSEGSGEFVDVPLDGPLDGDYAPHKALASPPTPPRDCPLTPTPPPREVEEVVIVQRPGKLPIRTRVLREN
ncbi:uncharacterized protein K452DRAFT_313319 [Aplosporella prunicola CBS 121167]|uniref:Uncharacterized protein n=1 Tax=Aplosporella prunicola CBS 121167 TaxID=1176127 RepID=A0A6A6AX20_9PEZI|nr:uncharacterized protein K452DRAFT_313319 [Aplosporella prunicola CBS 121167]KAF2136290.1 hypothetical protein K452DRAFT_313319 [Aplosporella prunicola CBS 121167]